jgi:hypothetical protein
MLKRLFLDHPASVGETYLEHLATATSFAVALIAAGLACLVHALVPCLFERSASRAISALHDRMVLNRTRRAQGLEPRRLA